MLDWTYLFCSFLVVGLFSDLAVLYEVVFRIEHRSEDIYLFYRRDALNYLGRDCTSYICYCFVRTWHTLCCGMFNWVGFVLFRLLTFVQ